MPPLRLPPWIHKTAHQRDIDLQGIIQSAHYVIMPLCHHAVKDFTGKRCIWAQRNSIYNINIIYTISLTSHIPFFLNGMMTLRHDGILHRRQNLPIACDPCANQL